MENEEFLRICKAKVAEYTNSHMDKTDEKQITVHDVYVVFIMYGVVNKTTTTSTTKGAGYMFNPELVKLGSTGTSVLLLQEILIARGFKGKNGKALTLSRKADENTIYALKTYQKSRKGVLEADGIAGEKTWKDLIAI